MSRTMELILAAAHAGCSLIKLDSSSFQVSKMFTYKDETSPNMLCYGASILNRHSLPSVNTVMVMIMTLIRKSSLVMRTSSAVVVFMRMSYMCGHVLSKIEVADYIGISLY